MLSKRKCGTGFQRRWNAKTQMRNGVPTASECQNANAERGSNGIGMPKRKCGMRFQRRRSAKTQVGIGLPEAPEYQNPSGEWASGGSGVPKPRWVLPSREGRLHIRQRQSLVGQGVIFELSGGSQEGRGFFLQYSQVDIRRLALYFEEHSRVVQLVFGD